MFMFLRATRFRDGSTYLDFGQEMTGEDVEFYMSQGPLMQQEIGSLGTQSEFLVYVG